MNCLRFFLCVFFLNLRMFYFHLHFWKDGFLRCRILIWNSPSFSILAMSSCWFDLHGSDERLVVTVNWGPLCVMSGCSCCFQDSLLAAWLWCTWVWSLNLFYFEFSELLRCVDACFLPTMENLGPLFFQILFLFLFFLLLHRLQLFARYYASCFPTGLCGSLHFSSFFVCLHFSDWIISIDLFQVYWLFCPLSLALESFYWVFHFSYCTFKLHT